MPIYTFIYSSDFFPLNYITVLSEFFAILPTEGIMIRFLRSITNIFFYATSHTKLWTQKEIIYQS